MLVSSKICTICKEEKELNIDNFYFRGGQWISACKKCYIQRSYKYRKKHREKKLKYDSQYYYAHREERKIKDKIYREQNKDRIKQYLKEYRWKKNGAQIEEKLKYKQEHHDEIQNKKQKHKKEVGREYRAKNKEKINESAKKYIKKRYHSDSKYRLRLRLSHTILKMLKNNGGKKDKSILKCLPYDIADLKQYLESKFESWMNWSNYGVYNSHTWDDNDPATWTWQIDHIIPQSALPYDSMSHPNFQKCWALANLRPYSAKLNVLEGARRSGSAQ